MSTDIESLAAMLERMPALRAQATATEASGTASASERFSPGFTARSNARKWRERVGELMVQAHRSGGLGPAASQVVQHELGRRDAARSDGSVIPFFGELVYHSLVLEWLVPNNPGLFPKLDRLRRMTPPPATATDVPVEPEGAKLTPELLDQLYWEKQVSDAKLDALNADDNFVLACQRFADHLRARMRSPSDGWESALVGIVGSKAGSPPAAPELSSLQQPTHDLAAEREPTGAPSAISAAPASPIQKVPGLRVDLQTCFAFYGGQRYKLKEPQALILDQLIQARGQTLRGKDFKERPSRPDKVIEKLPPELRNLIKSDPGPYGGYYIPPDIIDP
jgi:hypothetical protein